MSELDIDYISRTVAKGSAKRPALKERGGKILVPYLIDPNTGTEMYESEDIIDYLHRTYGHGRSMPSRVLSPLNTASAIFSGIARPNRGSHVKSPRAEQPERVLQLYNFEASPYCRKVRETLNELDLDYRVRNVAKRGRQRPELIERGGKMMVPYLIDPNTDTEMYESDDIVRYLHRTYG